MNASTMGCTAASRGLWYFPPPPRVRAAPTEAIKGARACRDSGRARATERVPPAKEAPPRRDSCSRCARPQRVCVCDALPSAPLHLATPVVVLQSRREAKRKLGSAPLLPLCLQHCVICVGRSLGSVARSEAYVAAVNDGLVPLVLFPHAQAMSAPSLREAMAAGARYFIVAVDGTWEEAAEVLKAGAPLNGGEFEPRPALFDVASLAPAQGRFAGCRKPHGPGCLSTLEAVAVALEFVEACRLGGPDLHDMQAAGVTVGVARAVDAAASSITDVLLRPMLRMVALQAALTGERQVHHLERPGYIPGLAEAALSAAAAYGVV